MNLFNHKLDYEAVISTYTNNNINQECRASLASMHNNKIRNHDPQDALI